MVRGFWGNETNQRKFMESVGHELGLKSQEDWYNVSRHQVEIKGGWALLNGHGSLAKTLSITFPEHEWNSALFANVPHSYWSDMRNQRSFFDWMAKKLGL